MKIRLLLLALTASLVLSSCNIAKICAERYPSGIDITSDEKDSTILKDTTIVKYVPTYLPGDSIVVSVPTLLHDTVIVNKTKYLNGVVTVKHGWATMECKTDSLQAVITRLEFKLQTVEQIKSKETTTVKTIRITDRHIPKWVWYLLVINLVYLLYKFYPSYSGIWKKV